MKTDRVDGSVAGVIRSHLIPRPRSRMPSVKGIVA
jgi:hypothetical protein